MSSKPKVFGRLSESLSRYPDPRSQTLCVGYLHLYSFNGLYSLINSFLTDLVKGFDEAVVLDDREVFL